MIACCFIISAGCSVSPFDVKFNQLREIFLYYFLHVLSSHLLRPNFIDTGSPSYTVHITAHFFIIYINVSFCSEFHNNPH
jgi:hypothetical protein